jgi:hypothetical protein
MALNFSIVSDAQQVIKLSEYWHERAVKAIDTHIFTKQTENV